MKQISSMFTEYAGSFMKLLSVILTTCGISRLSNSTSSEGRILALGALLTFQKITQLYKS